MGGGSVHLPVQCRCQVERYWMHQTLELWGREGTERYADRDKVGSRSSGFFLSCLRTRLGSVRIKRGERRRGKFCNAVLSWREVFF